MHFDRHVAYHARYRPDALFAQVGDQTLSWGEIDRLAGAMAAGLADMGLARGDRFGVLLPNSLEWCVGFLAAVRLGAIVVPFNTMFGAFELSQIARDAGCSLVLSDAREIAKLGIADTSAPDRAPDRASVYDMREGGAHRPYAALVATDRRHPRNQACEDDILAICYTSGTTGLPKGIALSHRAVDAMVLRAGQRVGLEVGQERFLVLAPLAFTGASLALAISGVGLNATGLIGLLTVVGISLNHGIVLLTYVRAHEKTGTPPVDAVRRAVRERLRPILLTALTAALGMLPTALGFGTGAAPEQGLAIVVLGGVLWSSLLSTNLLPALYLRWGRPRP